jgi:hypothetical protein
MSTEKSPPATGQGGDGKPRQQYRESRPSGTSPRHCANAGLSPLTRWYLSSMCCHCRRRRRGGGRKVSRTMSPPPPPQRKYKHAHGGPHSTPLPPTIPLPDGSRAEIEQINIMEAKKMLGVLSTLTGDDAKHLEEVIIEKTRTWVGRLRNSPLPHPLAWMAYHNQLWPGLCNGLVTLATQMCIWKSALHSLEFKMLPSLGVNRHVKMNGKQLQENLEA